MLKFCGIKFTVLNKKELLKEKTNGIKCINPINAQLIVMANTNERFMKYLNSGCNCFDGEVPLKVAKIRSKDFSRVEKLSGSGIVYDFAEYAKKKRYKMFFLGGAQDSNKKAVEKIRERYGIDVAGYSPDFESYPFSQRFIDNCNSEIESFKPEIIFIGFGAPKQEYYIEENREWLESIGVKFVVASGGTIDFVSGKVKRAPDWVQKAGLEGIYRLFQETNMMRLKRLIYSVRFIRYVKD